MIEVNALSVRHALANAFVASEPGDHVWRGEIGIKGPVVTVDVRETDGAPMCTPAPTCWSCPS